jgi:hypothetical protein
MRISIPAFTMALVLGGSVLAQNADVRAGASSELGVRSQSTNASLASGNEISATLTGPVDARRVKPGDEVSATIAEDTQTAEQVVLRRGTKLVGHVTEAQARARRSSSASASASGSSESRLGIVFDRAVLEDGREVPINATIQAVAASEAVASGNARDAESAGGSSALGSGRVSSSGPLGGGGIVGGITGSAGSALGGAPNVGAGLGAANSGAGLVGRASEGAVGGLSASGRLTAGSHGVFGMGGVDIAPIAGGGAKASTVLTSRTGNIGLERGTQLLLTSQAAIDRAPRE